MITKAKVKKKSPLKRWRRKRKKRKKRRKRKRVNQIEKWKINTHSKKVCSFWKFSSHICFVLSVFCRAERAWINQRRSWGSKKLGILTFFFFAWFLILKLEHGGRAVRETRRGYFISFIIILLLFLYFHNLSRCCWKLATTKESKEREEREKLWGRWEKEK